MAERESVFGKVRLVYKRSSNLTKIFVLAAIVLSMVALLVLGSAIRSARERTEGLRVQASRLEQENDRLSGLISSLGTVAGIQQIAREELGLVDPDSVIITPEK